MLLGKFLNRNIFSELELIFLFKQNPKNRHIKISETTLCIGCNRDTNIQALRRNLYAKIATRVTQEQLERFIRETKDYNMVLIHKPPHVPLAGQIEV